MSSGPVTPSPPPPTSPADTFPRQHARTRRFTLGRPRGVRVSPDGTRVVFLRSPAGDDPTTGLWVLDVPPAGGAAVERQVVDPRGLLGGDGEEDLPPEERARRERAREAAGGVVAYATDAEVTRACFALAGRLFVADLRHGEPPSEVPTPGPVFDPRLDPTGSRVAYTSGRALHVVDVASGRDRRLAGEDDPDVVWGQAEFVAAEEMGRSRGAWWSPDGRRLLAARVDHAPVLRWSVADPAVPEREPSTLRYPAAGTANARVTLALLDADADADAVTGAHPDGLDGPVPVAWDHEAWPYLARAGWRAGRAPLLLVSSRDQRRTRVLTVDERTGATTVVREDDDAAWVELVAGAPDWSGDRLVHTVDADDTRRLAVDGESVTPPGLQVRDVLHVDADAVLVTASEEPTEVHVHRWSPTGGLEALTSEPGVHTAAAGGDVVVVASTLRNALGPVHRVLRRTATGLEPVAVLASHAEEPRVDPRPVFAAVGPRALRTALLLPSGRSSADGGPPLPVLLDPYGGPHAQRVLATRAVFTTSQWFADQGFAVLVADGRGTPGRGPAWERAVHGDLASAPLEDQVDALTAVAAEHPGLLDLDRVAMRGWSFGGYLAALAVLRRPDAVHAAVAGAPVVDWRLYDTHYTERYLGDPGEEPDAYRRSSLLDDAPGLQRPLLLVHGLADDNVVAAHSLRLSSALLAAGRPHEFLPLSGVTHMTPQEQVAENLLLLQVEFLRRALRLDDSRSGPR